MKMRFFAFKKEEKASFRRVAVKMPFKKIIYSISLSLAHS